MRLNLSYQTTRREVSHVRSDSARYADYPQRPQRSENAQVLL